MSDHHDSVEPAATVERTAVGGELEIGRLRVGRLEVTEPGD